MEVFLDQIPMWVVEGSSCLEGVATIVENVTYLGGGSS